jgi:hypothetical protein
MCTFAARPSGCSIVSPMARRKVGTTQGAILPSGKASPQAGTASATENNRLALGEIRVKTWGKSPRVMVVTSSWGKPYGLQGQIYRHPANGGIRTARPMPEGRLLEPGGDPGPR